MRVSLADLQSYDPRGGRGGNNVRFLCNLDSYCRSHTGQDHRSLSVDLVTGAFYCHRCKSKGRLSDVEYNRETVVREQIKKEAKRYADPKESILKQVSFYRDMLFQKVDRVRWYLERRNIPWQIAVDAQLGFAPAFKHWEKNDDGEIKEKGTDERLVFPVYDERRRVVAYFARAIDDDCYLEPKKMFRGDRDKGIFFCQESDLDQDTIAICEGAFDCLALKLAGVAAVSINGTVAQEWLVSMLARKNVLLAFDNDAAGEKASYDLAIRLHPVLARTRRITPTKNDFGEMREAHLVAEIEQIVAAGKNIFAS